MTDFKLLFRLSPVSFNLSSTFTSQSYHCSPEASMKNMTIQQTQKQNYRKSISHRRNYSLGQDNITTLYQKSLEENFKLKKLKTLIQARLLNLFSSMNSKATKIQKIVKGFLVRKGNSELLIEKHKKYTFGLIEDLKIFTEKCYYSGKRLFKAVVKVQSVFRTWNFLKLNKAQLENMKKVLKDVKTVIKTLISSYKLSKGKKSFIKRKLFEIRKRLAMQTISKALSTYKKSRFKSKKHSRKISFDNLLLNFASKFPNPHMTSLHQPSSPDKSESSDESSLEATRFYSKKQSFDLRKFRPSLLGTIPVLIEQKRHSMIWVERFDEESKSQVIGLKEAESGAHLIIRKKTLNRPISASLSKPRTSISRVV